jgi:hypothetical protein
MEGHGSTRTWPRLFFQSCGYRVSDLSMGVTIELFCFYCMAAWSAGCDRLVALLACNIEVLELRVVGGLETWTLRTNSICYFSAALSIDRSWT